MTAAEKLAELVATLTDDGALFDKVNALLEDVRAESVSEFRTHFGARLAEMGEAEARACEAPGSRNEDTTVGIMAGIRCAGEWAKDPNFDF
jgi:hypothetical protein